MSQVRPPSAYARTSIYLALANDVPKQESPVSLWRRAKARLDLEREGELRSMSGEGMALSRDLSRKMVEG